MYKADANDGAGSFRTAPAYAPGGQTKFSFKLPDQPFSDCFLRHPHDAQVWIARWLHETNKSANAWLHHTKLCELEIDFVRNVTCARTRHKHCGHARRVLAVMRPVDAQTKAATVAHVVEHLRCGDAGGPLREPHAINLTIAVGQ